MAGERVQRQVDRLLDEAEEGVPGWGYLPYGYWWLAVS